MVLHTHRVQIAPVHMRAPFVLMESWSAGRKKSEAPARASAHCEAEISLIALNLLLLRVISVSIVVTWFSQDARDKVSGIHAVSFQDVAHILLILCSHITPTNIPSSHPEHPNPNPL